MTCAAARTLFGVVLMTASPVAAHIAEPAPIRNQGYHLVKDWDFGSTILTDDDLRRDFFTRYASDKGQLDHLKNEWEVYRDNNNHVLSGGALHLVARLPSGVLAPSAIESGMIRSKWTGKYGYYEAVMKVPRGRGLWPAFWFANEYWPPEIDVIEIVNNGTDDTTNSFHALHGAFIEATRVSLLDDRQTYRPGFDYADGFHRFAIEWTPTTVRHFVDDRLVVERAFQWKHDNGQDGEPTPVVVNLAVGGDWPGAPIRAEDFPASLDIKSIRVWQK
jgi:beta-glucanase (GH16 family)